MPLSNYANLNFLDRNNFRWEQILTNELLNFLGLYFQQIFKITSLFCKLLSIFTKSNNNFFSKFVFCCCCCFGWGFFVLFAWVLVLFVCFLFPFIKPWHLLSSYCNYVVLSYSISTPRNRP